MSEEGSFETLEMGAQEGVVVGKVVGCRLGRKLEDLIEEAEVEAMICS